MIAVYTYSINRMVWSCQYIGTDLILAWAWTRASIIDGYRTVVFNYEGKDITDFMRD